MKIRTPGGNGLQQPGKKLRLWFMDEARIGQKGRPRHRWWTKGERAGGSHCLTVVKIERP